MDTLLNLDALHFAKFALFATQVIVLPPRDYDDPLPPLQCTYISIPQVRAAG